MSRNGAASQTHPTAPEDEVSLTLRIPRQLRKDMKAYAAERGTNITQLTLDYYRFLLAQETQQEAEQF
jgi:hypothetical protein